MSNDVNITKYLEAAIRAEGIRQAVIANNVANIDTPGYRRFDVMFEELLAAAIESAGGSEQTQIEPTIFQPRSSPVNTNGNDVSLETEVGEIVKNSLRHQAFIRLLRKRYEQLELAMGPRY
jgi:flagellar basal-body rod protein FlgB